MKSFFIKRGFLIFLLLLLASQVLAQTTPPSEVTPSSQTPSSQTTSAPPTTSSTSETSTSQTSQSNSLKGEEWLLKTSTETTGSISDQSLALLALLQSSTSDLAPLAERLLELQDPTDKCWPKEGCTVQDTAYAYLALTKAGVTDLAQTKTWLKSSLIGGLRNTGDWRIQVEATTDGTCTLTWGENKKKDFTLTHGELSGTASKHYISVASDLRDSTLLSTPNNKVHIDCSSLGSDISGSGIVLSLVYAKSSTEFFLLESSAGSLADFTLSNGCFADEPQSSRCSYPATAIATWALVETNEKLSDLGTYTYLESSLGADEIQKAMLVRILLTDGSLSSNAFVNSLIKDQRLGDGSWRNGDIPTTSWAAFALSKSSESSDNIENARLYLERKQNSDGSWNQDITSTSLALLALRGELTSALVSTHNTATILGTTSSNTEKLCSDILDNDNDGLLDCADLDCKNDEHCGCDNGVLDTGEIGIDCGGTCPKPCESTTPSSTEKPECTLDVDCSGGASCKDGKCVQSLQETPECTSNRDCSGSQICQNKICIAKPSTDYTWLWVVLLLLILGGGGAFFYFRFVKPGKISLFKKKTTVSFEDFKRDNELKSTRPVAEPKTQPTQRPTTTRTSKPSVEDDELDKSLKEAERILKQ